MTNSLGTGFDIYGKFVVVLRHREEGGAEGIVKGGFSKLSCVIRPTPTVIGCIHASQTDQRRAGFRATPTARIPPAPNRRVGLAYPSRVCTLLI